MEEWTDKAILLSLRPHGEGAAVAALFSAEHGRHAGFVHGAFSKEKSGMLQPGNLVHAHWRARTQDQLGTYTLESLEPFSAHVMDDPLRLAALLSVCALCDAALPEREVHAELFAATQALLTVLTHAGDELNIWGEAYVKWEIALLRELGFSLDLSRCAAGGQVNDDLIYVSPKSGGAVSAAAGEPYKDRLLSLPVFLRPQATEMPVPVTLQDIYEGLVLSGAFMEKWAFAQHSQGVPTPRRSLMERMHARL